jgi:hypothetical protein
MPKYKYYSPSDPKLNLRKISSRPDVKKRCNQDITVFIDEEEEGMVSECDFIATTILNTYRLEV